MTVPRGDRLRAVGASVEHMDSLVRAVVHGWLEGRRSSWRLRHGLGAQYKRSTSFCASSGGYAEICACAGAVDEGRGVH